MNTKVMGLLFLVVPLVGCQTVWNHPTSNPQRFANDKLECQAMANRMNPSGGIYLVTMTFNTCMEGKGYTR